jgi:DUF1009 family protein
VERALALICGTGPLPARMARQARADGWRVVAFTFAEAAGVGECADRVVPSRVTEIAPVLAAFQRERVSAALFSGKFWMGDLVRADAAHADAAAVSFEAQARSRADSNLSRVVLSTLGALGIEVLDQRRFTGDWLAGSGPLTPRETTEDERRDVRIGLGVASALADQGVGQTVVIRHGVVTAVEAVEGTTAAIERGTALAGRGAAIVKAVARDHDYRFDLPAVGPETVDAAVRGGAAVLAIQAGRVAVLDRGLTLASAAESGLSVVGVDEAWPGPPAD